MAVIQLTPQDYSVGINTETDFWGTSITQGAGSAGGYPFPEVVRSQMYPRLCLNLGIGGQTMEQIGCRQGAIPIYITITGNIFNAANAVSITSISNEFLSTAADAVVRRESGIVAGVPCIITRSAVNAYTITPGSSSTAVVPANSIFYPDSAFNARGSVQILELGRNNVGVNLSDLPAIIDSAIAFMTVPRRFLVLGVPNGLTEIIGTPNYEEILEVNNILRANYPNNYVEMTPPTSEEMAAMMYVPDEQDEEDIANGTFPTGMMYDNVHRNYKGYQLIGNRVAAKLNQYNW